MHNVNKLINNYFSGLIKKAGLETDMAKRIMYNIIPALGIQSSEKDLDIALEGIKDILYYGKKACADEIYTSKNDTNDISNDIEYELYFNKCKEYFSDPDNWAPSFGGESWAKIAGILQKIAKQYENLNELKASYNVNYDEISKVKKDLIILLNLFDGMCHNSNSIMSRLIALEHERLGKSTNLLEDMKRINRLRHSTMLMNPVHVYKVIEPSLDYNVNRFKDYVSKMRSDISYKDGVDIGARLDFINFIDNIIPSQINKLKSYKKLVIESNSLNSCYSFYDKFSYDLDWLINNYTKLGIKIPQFHDIMLEYHRVVKKTLGELDSISVKSVVELIDDITAYLSSVVNSAQNC